MKILNAIGILLTITLTGCATTLKDYQGFIEKYPKNRFCALAVTPVAAGKTDDAVRTGRVPSHTHCDNTEESARRNAIYQCTNTIGRPCILAYEYDRNSNSYRSSQSKNMNDYQTAILESKMKKCDTYGFKRGTTPFAQCLQQVEQQESMNEAVQMQQNELNRQATERQFKKAQCYFSGRLDC